MNNTLFVGRYHLRLEEVDSTNTYLQEWSARENLMEGTVVSTAFQRQGRGQRGSQWKSTQGSNLLMSLLLYPRFLRAGDHFVLSQAVALAVRDFIAAFVHTEPVHIKWPNDILIGDAKVAGILIENTFQGESLKSSIIGIGININETPMEDSASLRSIMRKYFNPEEIMQLLFSTLEARYMQLQRVRSIKIREEYLQRLLGYRQPMLYKDQLSGEIIEGSIYDVSPAGKLLLQTAQGIREYDLKEISLLLQKYPS